MPLRRHKEVHVLVHVIVDKAFFLRDPRVGETAEEIRCRELQLHLSKVDADADYHTSMAPGAK